MSNPHYGLLLKSFFYLNTVDEVNDISLVEMYKNAIYLKAANPSKGIFDNHYRLLIGVVCKMSNV